MLMQYNKNLIRRALRLGAGAFALFFLLTSCSETEKSTPTAAEPATTSPVITIGLVMKTLTNPFFIEMERGARRAEKEYGIHLLVKTAAQETSIQQQIGIVEDLISRKVDAIVIAPGDSIELIPVLKQAQDAGIVVINIDNPLSPEYSSKVGLKTVPFISVDNELAAYQSASTLTRLMQQPTEVAIVEGIRGAQNAEDRKKGAIRAFNEHPLARLVASQSANWKIDEGYAVTEQLLHAHPNIGAIFCANDMMALGAIKYLQTADMKHVLVAGYDALEPAKQAILHGSLVATVDQQAAEQGYQGILFAVRALRGETLAPVTLIETRILTRLELN